MWNLGSWSRRNAEKGKELLSCWNALRLKQSWEMMKVKTLLITTGEPRSLTEVPGFSSLSRNSRPTRL
ncbi:hypothetical protein LINPERPRIM_LOCUS28383 [Linum perenne]